MSNKSSTKLNRFDLKIGVDGRYLANDISGIERYTLNLLRGITAAGPEFRVAVMVNDKNTLPADLQKSKVLEPVEVGSQPRKLEDQLRLPWEIGRMRLKVLHHPDSFARQLFVVNNQGGNFSFHQCSPHFFHPASLTERDSYNYG